jgi:ABC-type iron transport system FetAB ATPase subunit
LTHAALDIQHLELAFDDQNLFQDFNLRLEPGEKITLVGPSGCGKSTLMRCILGFVAPDAGLIRVFGADLTPDSAWELRPRMAYVPQEPELGSERVRTIVDGVFAFRNNRHLQARREHIPQLLERLLLPVSILDKHAAELSGGEKQRIALMLALVLERELLLLDEVTSALDKSAKHAVMQMLGGMESVSMLGIAHDQEWLDFADRVVEMGDKSGDGA